MRKIECPPGFMSSYTQVAEHNVHAYSSTIKSVEKPNIVLIHGAIVSRRYLMPTASRLLQSFNVYVPDMPGHGYSSKPHDALLVEQQAQVLREWIDTNRLGQTHLLANSYGCQVAVELAAEHGEVIDKIILVGPTVDPSTPTLWGQAMRLLQDGYFERASIPFIIARDIFDMGPKLAMQTSRRMMQYDITKKLHRVSSETLVVRGSQDTIVSQKWAETVLELLPRAQFALVVGAPHNVNHYAGQELSALAKRFLLPSKVVA